MSETWQPSEAESNAAFDAVLSPYNPLRRHYEAALEAENDLNEYIQALDEPSLEEIQEGMKETLDMLDKKHGRKQEEIVVTGRVRVRRLDHHQVEVGEPIERSAVDETWENVEDLTAHSIGYYAIIASESENPRVTIYHGARTTPTAFASDKRYGTLFRSDRLLIPVDGSVHVELATARTMPNWDLLDYYVDDALMDRVDDALDKKTLNSKIIALGKVSLASCEALKLDESVRTALDDYVNQTIGIWDVDALDYQISGARFVDIEDDNGVWRTSNINPAAVMTGSLKNMIYDTRAGRFRLEASMPFKDNYRRDVRYRINSKLVLNELPSFDLSSKLQIHRPS